MNTSGRKSNSISSRLAAVYLDAKRKVLDSGYAYEVDWQDDRSIRGLSESDFLSEAAWVVLSAGMREAVIRKLFPRVSRAFFNWTSAQAIVRNEAKCRADALRVFNHKGKINALIQIAATVHALGYNTVQKRLAADGLAFICELPYMGPATSYHLAKNLGLDVVKPDRHLLRVAKATSFPTPDELCRTIAAFTGERLSVVDLVIWRYATLDRQYVQHFASVGLDKKRNIGNHRNRSSHQSCDTL